MKSANRISLRKKNTKTKTKQTSRTTNKKPTKSPTQKTKTSTSSIPRDKAKLSYEARSEEQPGAKRSHLKGLKEAYGVDKAGDANPQVAENDKETGATESTATKASNNANGVGDDKKKKGPVITILSHGYGSKPEEMKRMAEQLSKKGLGKDGGVVTPDTLKKIDPKGRIFRVGYSTPKGAGMEKQDQKELSKMIAAIKKRTGASQVNFIGHSRGGRLGLGALKNDKNLKFNKMILLGSPVQGSKRAADPGTNKTVKNLKPHAAKGLESMRPGSEVTNSIKNGKDYQGRADITTITGRRVYTPGAKDGDGVVSPQETKLDGARNIDGHYCSHGDLANNQSVINAVERTLKGEKVPPGLVCSHLDKSELGANWKNFMGNMIDGAHTRFPQTTRSVLRALESVAGEV